MGKKISSLVITDQDRQRSFAAKLSLVIGLLLMWAKFWAYFYTGSHAVLSDAFESIVNVVGAVLLIFVIRYAAQPVDEDHPYGHGKVEYLSSAFEGGLIAFAALLIMIEAVEALLREKALNGLGVGTGVVFGAGIVNLFLGLFLIRQGRAKKSIALQSSGRHIVSDFWTSAGVVIGLLLVQWTNLIWLDSVIAIVVSLILARTGYKVVRESFNGLMDKEDPEDIKRLAQIFEKHMTQLVIQIHNLKVIRSGRHHHIDAHLVVPEYWNVKDIHENIQVFEQRVLGNYGYSGEIHFHLDPCRRVYCRFCDVPSCQIRKEDFVERRPVVLEDLRCHEEPKEFLR